MDTPAEPPDRDGSGALASRVAPVAGDVCDIKETLTDMRGILGMLLTAYACGLAALAILK